MCIRDSPKHVPGGCSSVEWRPKPIYTTPAGKRYKEKVSKYRGNAAATALKLSPAGQPHPPILKAPRVRLEPPPPVPPGGFSPANNTIPMPPPHPGSDELCGYAPDGWYRFHRPPPPPPPRHSVTGRPRPVGPPPTASGPIASADEENAKQR